MNFLEYIKPQLDAINNVYINAYEAGKEAGKQEIKDREAQATIKLKQNHDE